MNNMNKAQNNRLMSCRKYEAFCIAQDNNS